MVSIDQTFVCRRRQYHGTINYAWYLYHTGQQFITESGTTVYSTPTTGGLYIPGVTRFRISREGGNIVYYMDGITVRTVTDPSPTASMIADITMVNNGYISHVYKLRVGKLRAVSSGLAGRYGYQGSERDDEVKGPGNSYTTEFRQLDPRLGRWLTIDPKINQLHWQSPYCSMDNNPVILNDVLGDITDKQEKKLRKERKTLEKRIKKLSEYEKKWAERVAKQYRKNGGDADVVERDDNGVKRYTVSAWISDETIGSVPGTIANQRLAGKIGKAIRRADHITNLVDGYYYEEGEFMGMSISMGYDAYFVGGISGSIDIIFMAGEKCVGGTFGGGMGFGGGGGVDVGGIYCTKAGRYRAKDIQDGEGWEFAAGIGPLEYSRSGDRNDTQFHWDGATNTTHSGSINELITGGQTKAILSKSGWQQIYKAVMLRTLDCGKLDAVIKYEWNKSNVWINQ